MSPPWGAITTRAGCVTLQDPVDDIGCRPTAGQTDGSYATAVRHTVSAPTIASGFQSAPLTRAWGHRRDEPRGRVLTEEHHIIDGREGREDGRSIVVPVDRAMLSLDAADGAVGVQSDDQDVAEFARGRKILHVTAVQDVKCSVREDHRSMLSRERATDADKALE